MLATFKKVVFNLKRTWVIDGKTVDLYEEIKSGRKTSEWRDATEFWFNRLCMRGKSHEYKIGEVDLTDSLKVYKAWFVIGYPKNNLPRLEADITYLIYHVPNGQLEIQFTHVKEIKGDKR